MLVAVTALESRLRLPQPILLVLAGLGLSLLPGLHHLRTAMADRLEALRDEDEAVRDLAHQRLQVSRDVQVTVRAAQGAELLRLRDDGRIDDKAYGELQLELDRAALDDG